MVKYEDLPFSVRHNPKKLFEFLIDYIDEEIKEATKPKGEG